MGDGGGSHGIESHKEPSSASHLEALRGDLQFGFVDRTSVSTKTLHPQLIRNDGANTMLRAIKLELSRSSSFTFSVAFITPGAIALLKQDLLDYKGAGTIITSTYLDFNDPDAFTELLSIANIDIKVVDSSMSGFHAKGYVFSNSDGETAIVGSSNLTRNALLKNEEWNLQFSALPGGDIIQQVRQAICRQAENSVALTHAWIAEYSLRWKPRVSAPDREAGLEELIPDGRIFPNTMQEEALAELDNVLTSGERRALIVSATGTGKTILAALAAQNIHPERLLFLAHREQILKKARQEFARVFDQPLENSGLFAGGISDIQKPFVFATIQSIGRPDTLDSIDPLSFDLIIIDEVHRAGAATYGRIIDHFEPRFLLGLTATPERSDSFNVFELFDYNVPYEIRLQRALEEDMLAPFNYYGVEDFTDSTGATVSDSSQLALLATRERVDHIVQMLELYGHTSGVKGLLFCSHNDEARELSALLNERSVHGHRLRTLSLSGSDSIESREAAVQRLERGDLDYLLTVDIFNEGIDIPAVNQVVMLRCTQSSIIFTQQLGRGLRKAVGKDHLRVIDFIGNYANNFLIPIALFGDSSLNKDVIRGKLIEARAAGSIAGVSSINFQEVARERIFDSLARTNLDSVHNLKRAVVELEQRTGQVPSLYDFARFDTVDPVVVATKKKNYWDLLFSFKKIDVAPSSQARSFLTFMSAELLNGKRPHELLLLKHLAQLPDSSLLMAQYKNILRDEEAASDSETVESVIRILDLQFATSQDRGSYGDVGLISQTVDSIQLSKEFADLYESDANFKHHVDDILRTGLFLARHHGSWSGELRPGYRYSRKDVCRMLNWKSNQQGVMYGYKIDVATNTCPIFITYHKADDVAASTAYNDQFLDHSTMQWYTRSRVTLDSPVVRNILSDSDRPALHLFVKKDDAESGEFYYLGEASPRDAVQSSMPGENGKVLDVVTMKLDLEHPVEPEVHDYLTTSGDGVMARGASETLF